MTAVDLCSEGGQTIGCSLPQLPPQAPAARLCPFVRPLRSVPAPLAFNKLARDYGAGGSTAVGKQLSGVKRLVPDIQGAFEHRCSVTPHPEGSAFRNSTINAFLSSLFTAATQSSGLNTSRVELSRFDLFHGHIFLDNATRQLGVLLHAKEYPAQSPSFPYNLGFCQIGSPLEIDGEGMDWRNLLWFKNMLYALDLSESSPLLPALVHKDLRPLRTTYEGDFGDPLLDVYLFPPALLPPSQHRAVDGIFCYMRKS